MSIIVHFPWENDVLCFIHLIPTIFITKNFTCRDVVDSLTHSSGDMAILGCEICEEGCDAYVFSVVVSQGQLVVQFAMSYTGINPSQSVCSFIPVVHRGQLMTSHLVESHRRASTDVILQHSK